MGKGRGKGRAEKSVGEGKEGRGEKGKGCTDENTGRERGEIASWVQEDIDAPV